MNIKRKLNQFLVYWPPGTLIRSGETVYKDPIELKCRWEDTIQLVVDPSGEKWATKAIIDLDVPVLSLGVLWKGRFRNIAEGSESDPFLNNGASAVRMIEGVPNRRGNQILYTAYL